METSKIFISAPINLDWSTVSSFVQKLDKNNNVYLWDRESAYDQGEFDSCDAVVFLLPENKFKCEYREMPL